MIHKILLIPIYFTKFRFGSLIWNRNTIDPILIFSHRFFGQNLDNNKFFEKYIFIEADTLTPPP